MRASLAARGSLTLALVAVTGGALLGARPLAAQTPPRTPPAAPPSSPPPTAAAPADAAWEVGDVRRPVELGVRNARGTEAYRAIFTVRDRRTGRAYTRTLDLRGDARGTLRFPDDFAPSLATTTGAPRAYDWQCTVAGARVAYGAFVYPYFLQRVTPPPRP